MSALTADEKSALMNAAHKHFPASCACEPLWEVVEQIIDAREAKVRAVDLWFKRRLAVADSSSWTADDFEDLCDGLVRRLGDALRGEGVQA